MKKEYIKPEAEIQEIELQSIIATSMSAPDEEIQDGGESSGGMEAESISRRGEWGNLWAEPKDNTL